VSYLADDGEALIQRIRAREIGAPIPDVFLNTPLRVINPFPAPNGPLDCRGNCQTTSGNNVRGSQACIEFKCKKCCTDTFHTARKNNTPRDPCKTHKLAAVRDTPAIAQVPPPNSIPSPKAQTPPLTCHNSSSSQTGPSPSSESPSVQLPGEKAIAPDLSALGVSQTRTGSPTKLPGQSSNTQKGKARALAQPIGPNWLARKTQANSDNEKAEDLKVRRSRIDEELKRTVEFTIYFKVCPFKSTSPQHI